jgi:hypothetical protein
MPRNLEAIMSSRYFLFVVGTPKSQSTVTLGANFARCGTFARAAIGGRNGELIEITPVQLQFLRGVYAMNLEAPPGLPSGHTAVFAQDDDDPNGLLFFLDGEKPCAPMYAPRSLLAVMARVAAAEAKGPDTGPARKPDPTTPARRSLTRERAIAVETARRTISTRSSLGAVSERSAKG